ncbi:MAG: PHP-associated domain-containing protein [Cytobacillus gottheilii]|uniref:PHP-associated domain-containing protein n=1 Tax=Cytobacillus gottheilii TaxID=859144 RepID=UPI00082CB29B|nr:PHP-associated domain-containing protein [Cytobacillus gottheilii]
MIIDFHTHVKLAKRVDFDIEFFKEVILNAREAGLTAIAMTEHFNTKNYYEIYEQLDEHFDYIDDYYDVDGFKVFTGMEIDVYETGHILFIGHKERLLQIRRLLDFHTDKESFISLPNLLDLGEHHDLLMIGAHPLRETTPLHHHDPALLKRFHAFDLNGKDMHEHGIEEMMEDVLSFAAQLDIPVVCGSDSHHPIHIGVVKNVFEKDFSTAQEIREAIKGNQYKRSIAPNLHTKINAAKIVKKKMKEALTV